MQPYSEWRLVTAGGIKHRLVSQDGQFGEENADWTQVVIIRSIDLYNFVLEVFPLPVMGLTGIIYPRRMYPAGFPALRATGVRAEGLVTGRPIDPMEIDTTAPDGTYEEFLRLTISYSTCPEGDSPDPNDPQTFLEISGTGSGEFLTSPIDSNATLWEDSTTATERPDKDDLPVNQRVTSSLIEWSCKWNQISYDWWDTVLLPRIRGLMGKVNDAPMEILHDSPAETILFDTWSINQQFTWRNGYAGASPVTLNLRFIEKNFKDADDNQVTHNHLWRPNKGWYKLLPNGVDYMYTEDDLNSIFKP